LGWRPPANPPPTLVMRIVCYPDGARASLAAIATMGKV
jgi:hypothetical protein